MTLHTGSTGPPIRANSFEPEVLRQAFAGLISTVGVVNSGDLAVSQNGTPNMSVNVASGFAFVAGTSNAPVQGAYVAYNDAAVNLSVAASDPTNPRHDLVVLAIQDAYYTGATNVPVLSVITGTPAPSPADPTAPVSSITLARLQVNANATSIVTANITDLRLPMQVRINGRATARNVVAATDFTTTSGTAVEISTAARCTIVVPPSGIVDAVAAVVWQVSAVPNDATLYVAASGLTGWNTITAAPFSSASALANASGIYQFTGLPAGSATFLLGWSVTNGATLTCPASSRGAARNGTFLFVQTRP